MAHRITKGNLTSALARAAAVKGWDTALPIWTKIEGQFGMRARVNAVFLEGPHFGGGWSVAQMVNENGGERTLYRGSARELLAWLEGIAHE